MGFKNPVLVLLLLTASCSFALGENGGDNYNYSGEESEDKDLSKRESPPIRFGQKLMRKKQIPVPKNLEVDLELPKEDSYREEVIPSSTQAVNFPLGRTKSGRIPTKIMVRTFKTTTTTVQPETEVCNNNEISLYNDNIYFSFMKN